MKKLLKPIPYIIWALSLLLFFALVVLMCIKQPVEIPVPLFIAALVCSVALLLVFLLRRAWAKKAMALYLGLFCILNIVFAGINGSFLQRNTFAVPAVRQVGFNPIEGGSPNQVDLFILEMLTDKNLVMSEDPRFMLFADYAKSYEFEEIQYMPQMETPDYTAEYKDLLFMIAPTYTKAGTVLTRECSLWLDGIEEADSLVLYFGEKDHLYMMPLETYRAWEAENNA